MITTWAPAKMRTRFLIAGVPKSPDEMPNGVLLTDSSQFDDLTLTAPKLFYQPEQQLP
jgi:hypothetical protein